ncbi:MAG TPA: Gfo/Idh/MocA family oxidoreductase [Polyangiaceae bacterium]|nr:Gfo/Idh/MocA family oxidoreductase [Polyangiaceae bacterium]
MSENNSGNRDLALLGAGHWGKNLARSFDGLGALGVVCEASEAALESIRRQYPQVRTTSSYAEVLADPKINKVAIAAPAALHYELAEAALKAGKDVYVEKPLCLRLEHAEALVKLAGSSGKVLMVGHLLQYHPCVVRLRELVADGTLGKVLTITSNRLNLGKFRTEENALWSFAPHDISVILSLLGDRLPESVRCMGNAYLSQDVADSTITVMRFSGNVMAQIYVTWLNPFKEQKLTIAGSDGMAVFDDTKPWAEKLTLYRKYLSWAKGQEPVPLKVTGEAVAVPEGEPLRAECDHFLSVCRDRQRPRTDGPEGLRVLQVLDMAQRSLEAGGDAVQPKLEGTAALRSFFAHPTAIVDSSADIGKDTKIWHFCHVMAKAKIGERCILGQNVNVAGGVVIGNNVKVQNNVSIYTGTLIEDDVFLGPSCVLTNVTNPRSQVNRHSLYEKTLFRRGATVGANATIVCGITLGRYSFIAAGAVVAKDVPDYALVVGNPARQMGWMSRHGHRLKPGADGVMVCPESGLKYRETSPGMLQCLDLDEEAPLPDALKVGKQTYDELKA